ncbi:FeoA family protein [Flavicella sediminum]|uniref:FeoA family protein n=1 Tax=Flavicella sediminum TaxID=2585141 RepID=UPI001122FEC7|nr:FeoA family protein [Flavicella sediminum]
MRTVADLKKGEMGTIENLSFDEIPLALMEMGCIPGKQVTLIQRAPMNDPLYISVNGSHFAIRRETAECIVLTKLLCDEI